MTLFQEAFHTSENVFKIYQSWILQELTPLKVTFSFNYLYVQVTMIDIEGDVRRYRIPYKHARYPILLWQCLRLAYVIWNDVIHARQLRYEKLYPEYIVWRRKRQVAN